MVDSSSRAIGLSLRASGYNYSFCLSAAGAITYGLLSILLITPLLGLLAVQLPLQPPGLALGLGVFCAMPTALSSGITFTQVSTALGLKLI